MCDAGGFEGRYPACSMTTHSHKAWTDTGGHVSCTDWFRLSSAAWADPGISTAEITNGASSRRGAEPDTIEPGMDLSRHRTHQPDALAEAAAAAIISIRIRVAFPSSCPWPSLSPAPLSP
jgi:hypothetical protein